MLGPATSCFYLVKFNSNFTRKKNNKQRRSNRINALPQICRLYPHDTTMIWKQY